MIERTARRAVILTPEAEVLLMQIREPSTGWTAWITPGGGADSGETPEETIRREVFEETGLHDFEPGPAIWRRDHTAAWEGVPVRQIETFYLIRPPRFTPTFEHQPESSCSELRAFLGLRWWPLAEIEASQETFVPRRMGTLLRDVVENGPPARPIDVGV